MSTWIKIFMAANAFLIQKTKGRLGNRLGKQTILLLHTTGRKTGKAYTTPLAYYQDDRTYLLVASNWGEESHPGWFHNLQLPSRTTIQVGAAIIPVDARQAEGEEYKRLWDLVTRHNDQYLKYQKSLTRKIPIVILTRITSA